MKKIIFLTVICMVFCSFLNAQTVLFADDFESYSDGTGLSSVGYDIWEGTARVTEGSAFDGTKYVNCTGTANKTFYLRKTVTLSTAGSYTLTLATQAPASKEHRIGYKFASSSAVVADKVTNTNWQEYTVDITAETAENITFWVQFFGAGNVHVDKLKLTKNISTAATSASGMNFSVVNTSENGLFRIIGAEKLKDIGVLDIHGRMVIHQSDNMSTINLTGFPDGIYILKTRDIKGNTGVIKLIKH